MRPFLFLAGASGVGASGLKNAQALVEMLQGMLTESTAENERDIKAYDKVACDCEERAVKLMRRGESHKIQENKLEAKKTILEADRDEHLGLVGVRRSPTLDDARSKVALATADVESTRSAENVEVENAKRTAEVDRINIPHLESEQETKSAEHALCMEELTAEKKRMNANLALVEQLIKSVPNDSSSEAGARAAGEGPVNRGRQVKQLLTQLRTKVQKELQTLGTEGQGRCDEMKLNLSDVELCLEQSIRTTEQMEKKLEAIRATLAETEDALQTERDAFTQVTEEIQDHAKACTDAKVSETKRDNAYKAESAGLKEALDILAKIKPNPEFIQKSSPKSFLQVGSVSNLTTKQVAAISRAASLLVTRAKQEKLGIALVSTAVRMQSGSSKNATLTYIVTLLEAQIAQLKEGLSNMLDANEKCQKDISRLKSEHSDATLAHSEAVSTVKDTKFEKNDKETEKSELEKDLKEAEDTLKTAVENLANLEGSQNKKKATAEENLSLYDEVLTALENAYKDIEDDDTHSKTDAVKTRQTASGGAVDLINTLKKESTQRRNIGSMETSCGTGEMYAKASVDGNTSTDTACTAGLILLDGTTRNSQALSYQNEIKDLEENIDRLTAQIKALTAAIEQLKADLLEAEEAEQSAKSEQEARHEKLEKQKQACMNSAETFEQRKRRRAEEVKALEEAIVIVNGAI